MNGEAFLNRDDFSRLLCAGARSFLVRRHGAPPAGMEGDATESVRWRDLPFRDAFGDFEKTVLGFLGLDGELDGEAALDPEETPAASGGRLWERWRTGARVVVFHTSGSTGSAVACPHSEELALQEAQALSGLFPGIRRTVCVTPPFHSYGFIFGFLLPRLLGIARLDLPPLPTFLADRLAPGDLLIGFPLFLGKLSVPPPPGVRCLCSTAPCPPALFSDLERLGFAGMTEIYGSSETGAIAGRTSGDAPFLLLPHWRKDGADRLLRTDPRTGEALRPRLPDYVEWRGGRELVPIGRRDKAVQVAGINVYPERIAGIVSGCPLVAECAVRPMRPEEGERLKAFVVPEAGADPAELRTRLRRFFRETFSPAERPGSIVIGPELPRTPAGKLADWNIPDDV